MPNQSQSDRDPQQSDADLGDMMIALAEIMDADDIAGWMEEPTEAFRGSTPLQVVERGEIDRLWQMIYAVRSGQPI